MFNEVLTLVAYTTAFDSIGNQKKLKSYSDVLCEVRSCTRYERYNYAVADRIPEFVVTINSCEYHNEVDCEFRGKKYNIARTYEADRDLIELTLERNIGQND